MKKYIIQNYLSIMIILISIFIIGFSFYQYFNEVYGYAPKYYELKEQCEHDKNEQSCKEFDLFSPDEDPKVHFSKLDAITLTCQIVQDYAFNYMQLLAPLFVIVITINSIHKEISSGMFKNYLMRMKYKDYIKKLLKTSLKPALLIPCLLALIFLISCIITNFNFTIDSKYKMFSIYDSWKYKNFLVYGILLCLIQYLMAIFYGNLGLTFCKKNKNKVISIFLGYISFFVIDIISYVVIYALIINKIFGYHNLMRYFNLIGYLYFAGDTNFIAVIIITLLLVAISSLAVYVVYKDKEGMVLANEKENG